MEKQIKITRIESSCPISFVGITFGDFLHISKELLNTRLKNEDKNIAWGNKNCRRSVIRQKSPEIDDNFIFEKILFFQDIDVILGKNKEGILWKI